MVGTKTSYHYTMPINNCPVDRALLSTVMNPAIFPRYPSTHPHVLVQTVLQHLPDSYLVLLFLEHS